MKTCNRDSAELLSINTYAEYRGNITLPDEKCPFLLALRRFMIFIDIRQALVFARAFSPTESFFNIFLYFDCRLSPEWI
jgi:hypothetical protein